MSTPFVIVGAPRTGSTLLVRTLNSLDGVLCHGELLQRNMVRGYEDGFVPEEATADERESRKARLLASRDSDPLAFVDAALAGSGLATGLKITYEIFFEPRWQAVIDHLLARGDIRFIHLTRNNGLRRYVSEQVLYAGGPNHSGAGGRSELAVQIAVDIDAFLAREAEIAADRARVDGLLSGHPVLDLSYEELAADIATGIGRTCAFLDPAIDTSGVRPALEKVGAADLAQTVSNVTELLEHPATRELVAG